MWLYRNIKHNGTQINFIDLYHLHMNTNAFINVRFGSIWHGLLLFGGGALSPNSILAPTSVLLIIYFKWSMNLQHSFFVPYANIETYLLYNGKNMFQWYLTLNSNSILAPKPIISIFNLLCAIAIVSNSKESIVNDGNRQTWLNLEITST